MVTVSLIITQSGTPGTPGVSRDDLSLGVPVVISNDNNAGVTVWSWRLLARPSGSAAALLTNNDPTTQFTPDLAGSYLIELKVNGRARGRIIAAVKTVQSTKCLIGLLPRERQTQSLARGRAAVLEKWNSD